MEAVFLHLRKMPAVVCTHDCRMQIFLYVLWRLGRIVFNLHNDGKVGLNPDKLIRTASIFKVKYHRRHPHRHSPPKFYLHPSSFIIISKVTYSFLEKLSLHRGRRLQ
jgi:hypothetical protein